MNSVIIVAEISAGAVLLGIAKDIWVRRRTEISEKEGRKTTEEGVVRLVELEEQVHDLEVQSEVLKVQSEAYKFAARDLPDFLMDQIKTLQDEKAVAEREKFVAEWRLHEIEEERRAEEKSRAEQLRIEEQKRNGNQGEHS